MLVQEESVHKKLSLVRTVDNIAINYAITANELIELILDLILIGSCSLRAVADIGVIVDTVVNC